MVTLSYDLALENAKEFDNKPEKTKWYFSWLASCREGSRRNIRYKNYF